MRKRLSIRPFSETRPTLRDVAEAAGVSPSAASRALNGKSRQIRIREETRKRVLDAATRLGYQPHRQALGLRLGRTHILAVCLRHIGTRNGIMLDLLKGMFNASAEKGMTLHVRETRDESEDLDAIRQLVSARAEGLFVWPRIGTPETGRYVTELAREGLPVVAFEPVDPSFVCPFLGVDHLSGWRMAVDHLVELGHRRIAHIGFTPPEHIAAGRSHLRYKACEEAMKTLGVSPRPSWLLDLSAASYEGGYTAAKRLLRPADRPTAICAFNDRIAMAVMNAAREAGLSVPGDLSVVGYDNAEYAAYGAVPLTTVHHPLYEVGKKAVEMLIGGGHPKECLLMPSLVVRASTGPPGPTGKESV